MPVPDPAPDDGDDDDGDDESGDDDEGDSEPKEPVDPESGDGGDDDDGGSDATDPVDPDSGEECELTGISICELQEIPCETDADCPTSWICAASPSVAVPCTFDAESGEEDCGDIPPEESQCSPPGWHGGGISPTAAAEAYNALDAGTGNAGAAEKATESDEASDGGCQGSPMPATSFVWALVLFLGACMRRRVLE